MWLQYLLYYFSKVFALADKLPHRKHVKHPQLEERINEVGILPTVNRWDEALALGVLDPHDSLSHPVGVPDVKAESTTRVDPDQFTNFVIPKWLAG